MKIIEKRPIFFLSFPKRGRLEHKNAQNMQLQHDLPGLHSKTCPNANFIVQFNSNIFFNSKFCSIRSINVFSCRFPRSIQFNFSPNAAG
jgi:hypothetical protein